MTKNNVLLVVAPGYEAPRATAYALERARQANGRLIALAVLDPEAHHAVAKTLSDVGFVGERVSEDVVEALEGERRTFAEEQLRQIGEAAAREGVSFSGLVEEGEPTEVCERVARAHGVGFAVLVAEKRSWVTRFLSRSAPVRLPSLADCEVKVLED
jgi:hypothetical protein